MAVFSGARQGTQAAVANQQPGIVTPAMAASTMHDELGEEARKLANGNSNVPTHPAMTPTEGADTGETNGDSQTQPGVIIVKGAKPRGTPG